jgi:hypothetical protein
MKVASGRSPSKIQKGRGRCREGYDLGEFGVHFLAAAPLSAGASSLPVLYRDAEMEAEALAILNRGSGQLGLRR